jgi:hypothetical protein
MNRVPSSIKRLCLIALFFLLLTLFFLFPLPLHLADGVVGEPTDSFYFLWLFGWFKESLFQLHVSPLFAPQINYPAGWSLAYNEIAPLPVLIGLPFTFVGGPALGYNMSIIIAFVLSGLGMYLWVRYLTHNHAAALIAGAIFTFCSYRMVESIGHPHLLHTEWFPLYFLSLHRLLENETSPLWKPLTTTTLLVLCITLTSPYYTYMAMVVSAIYVLLYALLFIPRSDLPSLAGKLSLLLILSFPLVLIALLPYLQLVREGTLAAKPFDQVNLYSASPLSYIVPSRTHAAWAWLLARIGAVPPLLRNHVFAGSALIGLSLITLILRPHFPDARQRRLTTLLFCSALAAVILSMGTNLYWLDRPVVNNHLIWPHFPELDGLIPLPGYFLYRYVPLYNTMRAWFRYVAFFFLFAGALSGLGVAYVLDRLPRSARILAASGLLLFVILDFYPGFFVLSSIHRPLDAWLRTMPDDGAVIQLPVLGEQTGAPNVYGTLIHGKPYAGDYYASFLTPQFTHYQRSLVLFPYANSIDVLHELGVRYVLVETSQYDAGRLQAIEDRGLHPAGVFDRMTTFQGLPLAETYGHDDLTVYILPDDTPTVETCGLSPTDPAPTACVEFNDATLERPGWHFVEVDRLGTSYRWLAAQQADLAISGPFSGAQRLTFHVMYTISPDVLDSLTLSANGQPLDLSREADGQAGWIYSASIPADAIARNPGELVLTFTVDRVVVPREIGLNDDRALAIALDWLRIEDATPDP